MHKMHAIIAITYCVDDSRDPSEPRDNNEYPDASIAKCVSS